MFGRWPILNHERLLLWNYDLYYLPDFFLINVGKSQGIQNSVGSRLVQSREPTTTSSNSS